MGAEAADDAGDAARDDDLDEGVRDLVSRPLLLPPSAAKYLGFCAAALAEAARRFLFAVAAAARGVRCCSCCSCSSAARALAVLDRLRVDLELMVLCVRVGGAFERPPSVSGSGSRPCQMALLTLSKGRQ